MTKSRVRRANASSGLRCGYRFSRYRFSLYRRRYPCRHPGEELKNKKHPKQIEAKVSRCQVLAEVSYPFTDEADYNLRSAHPLGPAPNWATSIESSLLPGIAAHAFAYSSHSRELVRFLCGE